MQRSITGRYVPLYIAALALLLWAWSALTFHAGDKHRAIYLLLAASSTAGLAGAAYAHHRKRLDRHKNQGL